ncbi:MAG: hypothetical protein DBY25_00410 [Clostridiales bacterium]|nr:MAG: hypothetical protein DBY25_00410 [Clostridiales bacterium]
MIDASGAAKACETRPLWMHRTWKMIPQFQEKIHSGKIKLDTAKRMYYNDILYQNGYLHPKNGKKPVLTGENHS